VIANNSSNINSGIEHDYVTSTLKGGDESHSVASLSRIFHVLAQMVKDAQCKENMLHKQEAAHQNSIMDNLPLCSEASHFQIQLN
jgi:hypothetical protein